MRMEGKRVVLRKSEELTFEELLKDYNGEILQSDIQMIEKIDL
ncbi:hypothetical protein NRIC_09630 [Enterococcus florum]|uniref:Uncharacterized protein n=1 Tax=Enterococcus florum TaxID=2480627 RepID=A0A4P5PCB5_9ENTE|nr:hypothetical protein NRIC_09630 [Enterococcus florum]